MNYCESCKLFGGHRAIPKGSKSPELYVLSDLVLNFDDTTSGGEYLGMSLRSAGFNTDNMRYFSIVRCNIENATNKELDEYRTNCINYAKEDIIKRDPSLVLLVGGSVSKMILGDEFKKISSSRGRIYSVDINGISIKVMPIYSPKFVLNNTYFQKDFMDDIAKARSYIDGKLIDISDKVMLSATTYDEFKDFYDKYLVNSESPAFDLETNAEEPHSNKINIIGFSFGADDGIHGIYVVKNSLEYQMPDEDYDKIVQLSKQILESKVIRVHNIKYELPVTYNCWGTLVAKDVPDFDDSLIKARMILGGKTGAGLKPRCQSELGYPDWETDLNDYRSAFTGLIAGYHKTAAGKERWDYEKFIKLPDMYSVSEMYSSYEDKDLDKRSTNNKNCVNSLINIVEDYYDEDESKYILGLIKEKITDLIYIDYTGPFSYAFLPKKIIEKYGAIDSIGCIDLNNHYDQKIKEFSEKLHIDLDKGYEYFKDHYLLSAWMEINGLHWNDKIARNLYKWYNETCIKCTKEMLSNPDVIDYIFENQRSLYNQYLIDNHLDEVERVLGKIKYNQKYNLVFEKDNKKISKKNILYEMGEDYINEHKQDIIDYAMSLTKDYKDYRDYKWLFNPASPSLNKLLDKIMVDDDIKVAKMYFMMEHLTEDPNFSLSNYDTGSAKLFRVILDANEYYKYMDSDDETKTISDHNYFKDKIDEKVSKRYILEYFFKILNSNNIQSREVMDIANDALNYSIESCDEPTMIDLSNYFVIAGIDFDDKNTWTPSYHFLFYFRLWKKCNKMISSYLDGSKVGRGCVYQVSKKGLESGEFLTRREKNYFDKDIDIHDSSQSYVMQSSFNTCGVQSFRWSSPCHCLVGDTPIVLTNGTVIPISEVVNRYNQGTKDYVYALKKLEDGTSEFVVDSIKEAYLSYYTDKTVKITLDNGESFECTLDHRMVLRDGSYIEAQNLKVGDSLYPATFGYDEKYYRTIYNPDKMEYKLCHYLADEYNERHGLLRDHKSLDPYRNRHDHAFVRHHVDFDKFNNNPENVMRYRWTSHFQAHFNNRRDSELAHINTLKRLKKELPDDMIIQEKYYNRLKKFNDKEARKNQSKTLKERYKNDPEFREHISNIGKKGGHTTCSNPEFQAKVRDGNTKRLLEVRKDPDIAEKIKNAGIRICLYNNTNPEMKIKQQKAKIAKVISQMLADGLEVTKDNYNNCRVIYKSMHECSNNSVPLMDRIMRYFNSFEDAVEAGKHYNHKVVNIEIIHHDEKVPVYSIAVGEPNPTFALGCGVVSHNTLPTGADIKNIFTPRFKYGTFFSPDASQAEIRFLAGASGCNALLEAFRNGADIHRTIAAGVWGKPPEEITSAERRFSKMCSFSIIYGATPESFANNYLHGDTARGRAIYDGFYSAYPEIKQYMNDRHNEMKKYGIITNRITPLFMYCSPEMYGGNENQAKRIAGNAPIQSGSSMLVGITGYQIMKYIREHNFRSKMVCFIHDSLECEIAPEELIELSSVVVPMMNNFPDEKFGIPMKTHLILGPSFGQEVEFDKFECNDNYSECWMEGEGLKQDIDQWYNNIHEFYDVFEIEVLEAKEKYISWSNLYIPKHAISQNYGRNVVEERVRVHIQFDKSNYKNKLLNV